MATTWRKPYTKKTIPQPSMSQQSASSCSSDEFDDNESVESLDLEEDFNSFIAEQAAFDSIASSIEEKLRAEIEEEERAQSSRRQSGSRAYLPRDREQAHEKLVSQYFSEAPVYTNKMFRTRFRMGRSLFLRIVTALGEWSPYFTERVDATN